MTKPKAGPISADRLKSFIERIERLREEKKAVGSDERDVFAEAKGVGYDTKAMREVLKRRAMDESARDEWDNIVDTYEHALGSRGEAARIVSGGGTYEEAAEQTGLSRASVARAVASRKNLENDTPEIGADTPARSTVADTPDCVGSAPGTNAAGRSPGGEGEDDGFAPTEIRGSSTGDALHAGPGCGGQSGREVGGVRAEQPHVDQSQGGTAGDARAGKSEARQEQVDTATILRSQIPSSTDKDRLEREAVRAEGNGLELPAFLDRRPAPLRSAPQVLPDDGGRQ